MQQIEIVFFAALAVFLGWKLYAALGRRQDGDAERSRLRQIANDDRQPSEKAKPVALPEPIASRDRRRIEADLAAAPQNLRDGLAAIAAADPAFDLARFLTGAKRAFEMILTDFAAGNAEALARLLAPDIHRTFAAAIAERQKRGERLKTTLVGILDAALVEARLEGSQARIAVKFTTQQIGVTEDSQGRIVDGDPQAVATIIDLFTFARDAKAADPNWQIVATASGA